MASAERFDASQHFKESVAFEAEVKISWLGTTFQQTFVSKVEQTVDAEPLQVHELLEPSSHERIMAELADRAETTLGHLWCLLKRQPNGEVGVLLINTLPNILYVRDVRGVLAVVDVVWGGAGWEIGASSTDDQRLWSAGHHIVSRR